MNTQEILNWLDKSLNGINLKGKLIAVVYTKQDEAIGLEFVKRFQKREASVWSEDSLLPGNDWNLEQSEAIDEAYFVIILVSKNSTTKSGFYQKMLETAVQQQLEMVEGGIKTIPIVLEDCEVPRKVREIYNVNAQSEKSMMALGLSFEKEWERRTNDDDWKNNANRSGFKGRWK